MSLKHTPLCEFGKKAKDFKLPDTDGRFWTLQDATGPKGVLVMFISNHCPYVKAILPKLVRDCAQLRDEGIASVAIMSNDVERYPADSMENMRRIAAQSEFPFPYLLDADQQVAKAYGAVCTPDFFGYNRQLELQYRGRLDGAGAQAEAWDEPRELFDAMKRIAETGQGPQTQYASMGCSIKWKPGNEPV